MKKRLIIIISMIIFTVLIVNHGWRLLGFDACINPHDVSVNIKVEDDTAYLTSTIYTSADFLTGYRTKVEGNNLYVGIRYQLFNLRVAGNSKMEIPLNEDIDNIYIKGDGFCDLVWQR